MRWTLVNLESPFTGDVERNLKYLRVCMKDSLLRGEAPYASHGLYTQPGVLDDTIPDERRMGIAAGIAWQRLAEKTVVYTDLGMSSGMMYGVSIAEAQGQTIEYRMLGSDWDKVVTPDEWYEKDE